MAMFVSGSASSTGSLAKLELYSSAVTGSDVFTVNGKTGRLFSVVDEMSGSIFSANTIAGLPVIEAFSDNTVNLGPFSSPVQIDSSGNISGSSSSTGSFGRLDIVGGIDLKDGFGNSYIKYKPSSIAADGVPGLIIGDVDDANTEAKLTFDVFNQEANFTEMNVSAPIYTATAHIRGPNGSAGTPSLQLGSANDGFFHVGGIGVQVNNVHEFLFADGGDFHADGDIIAYSTTVASDKRLKTNVQSISGSLYKLKQLRPIEFDWLVDRDRHEYGLIAQEVDKVVPELIVENRAIGDTKKFLKNLDGTETFKTVDYAKLTVLLVDAMKEQQEQINELKTEIQELKNGLSQ